MAVVANMLRAAMMNEGFSPVYSLFMNLYLCVLDGIFLSIMLAYIVQTIRESKKAIQLPFAIAITTYIAGNTISRVWVTIFRWLAANDQPTAWMLKVPVLPLGLLVVSIGLGALGAIVIGSRYGVGYSVLAIVVSLLAALLLSL